ncbi:MAG: glycosyltransferase family 1 protein [Alphaproteobacteria bacterium]|jgi:glycosyltransferase involved in cell wall biosynthesis|nr:MAG: glycosyltransferase family 1 protein [Alphaproteobacteria bacterium]
MTGDPIISRQIKVLGTQNQDDFVYNSPPFSRHRIDRRRYVPLGRIYKPMDGAKVMTPWPLGGADLVHAWRRIPLGPTPFVVGFDWHLPLTWEHSTQSFAMLMDALLSPKCRRIVASSQAAASAMLHRHEKHPRHGELQTKTVVRLPGIDIPDTQDWFDPNKKIDELRLVFVGDHFARKGGCVAVKLAEKALAAGVPLHITIVSSQTCGVWTDPTRPGFFDPYLKLCSLPNVTLIPSLPKAETLDLIGHSHLTLMPSFGDTLEYTVMEGMARHTPAIVTATCSFPEFIDADSGVLLPLETTCQGEWKHIGDPGRDKPEFEALFANTVDRLAEQTLAVCADLIANPARLGELRKGARRMAETKLNAKDASRFWDELYVEALSRR